MISPMPQKFLLQNISKEINTAPVVVNFRGGAKSNNYYPRRLHRVLHTLDHFKLIHVKKQNQAKSIPQLPVLLKVGVSWVRRRQSVNHVPGIHLDLIGAPDRIIRPVPGPHPFGACLRQF